MAEQIGPRWSSAEKAAGTRLAQTWEEFFSSAEAAEGTGEMDQPTEDDQTIARVQARHEGELMRYPNVVAVAPGVRTREGKPTGERCLVVYVERKVPEDQLAESEKLPRELDGVPIDVVEVGEVGILPA